ncbi:MAG: hypothetical protein FJ249_02490 [Nitrospira sp.]|nr:hypothetical protein [Nitrospira sp.]
MKTANPAARLCGWLALSLFASGCVTEPPPIVVYEEPRTSIWLMFDPEAGKPGHSHPARFTNEQMEQILRGIWVTDRDRVFGRIFHEQEHALAFSELQIKTLAPVFVQAFKKASPVDLVTFYLLTGDMERGKLVTSGGLFVRNNRLYFILANYRTSPSTKIYETTYEIDARDQPLLPVARYIYAAGFRPPEAWIPNGEVRRKDGYERYMDESKLLIVDLARLFAESDQRSLTSAPPQR